MPSDTIPMTEVARRLGISPHTAYAAARRGDIPCRIVGPRRFIVPRAWFEAWLAGKDVS